VSIGWISGVQSFEWKVFSHGTQCVRFDVSYEIRLFCRSLLVHNVYVLTYLMYHCDVCHSL